MPFLVQSGLVTCSVTQLSQKIAAPDCKKVQTERSLFLLGRSCHFQNSMALSMLQGRTFLMRKIMQEKYVALFLVIYHSVAVDKFYSMCSCRFCNKSYFASCDCIATASFTNQLPELPKKVDTWPRDWCSKSLFTLYVGAVSNPTHQYLITGQRDRPDVSISHWLTYLLLWVRFHISLLYVLSNLLNGLSVINSLPLFTGWWFNPLISSRLVQSGTESYLVNIFR